MGFTAPATHPHLYPTEAQDKVSGERSVYIWVTVQCPWLEAGIGRAHPGAVGAYECYSRRLPAAQAATLHRASLMAARTAWTGS